MDELRLEEELRRLQAELHSLKRRHGDEIAALEKRLDVLSRDGLAAEQAGPVAPEVPAVEPDDDLYWDGDALDSGWDRVQGDADGPTWAGEEEGWPAREPRRPARRPFGGLRAELLRTVLGSWLLGPFHGVLDQARAVYRHYKEADKLPVFFMTVIGIVALLAGVGYVLRYSFAVWLAPGAKVAVGFASAVAIGGAGAWVQRRGRDMAEYGSALIGLGVILNYLCIFFLASYYHLVSAEVGFALLAANTLLSYGLALGFETRVVAVVALVGGAFTPFLLDTADSSTIGYLSYLLLLVAVAMSLARRIRFPALTYLALVIAAAMLELSVAGSGELRVSLTAGGLRASFLSLALIHAYGYLFLAHGLFEGRFLRREFRVVDIGLVAVGAVMLLGNLYEVVDRSRDLGLIYLANGALGAGWLAARWRRVGDATKAVWIGLAATLLAAAAAALTETELRGALWAQEGLLLLYLGLRLDLRVVRREAYAVLVIAVAQFAVLIPSLQMGVPQFFRSSPFLAVCALTLVTAALELLGRRYAEQLEAWEGVVTRVVAESSSALCLALWLLTAHRLLPQFAWGTAVVPLFGLLWRGHRRTLPVTEALGLGCWLLLALQLVQGALAVGSFRFLAQDLYGKLAYVETLAVLWLVQEFYQRCAAVSPALRVAKGMRLAFYLLVPVIMLPPLRGVFRVAPGFVPLALWGSVTTAYLLARWLQDRVLWWEVRSLAIVAAAVSVAATLGGVLDLDSWLGFVALLAGGVTCAALVAAEKRTAFAVPRQRTSAWPLLAAVPAYLCVASAVAAAKLTSSVPLSLYVASAAALAMALGGAGFQPARKHLRGYYRAAVLTLAAGQLVFAVQVHRSDWWGVAALLFSAGLVAVQYRVWASADRRVRWVLGRRDSWSGGWSMTRWGLLSYLTAATYLGGVRLVTGAWLGPYTTIALTAHGIALLFYAAKSADRTALRVAGILCAAGTVKLGLYDISGLGTVPRIIALLAVGCLLLAGAYQFQRIKERYPQPAGGRRDA